jgi:CMP-N-acetylneuraminic acid synthetase
MDRSGMKVTALMPIKQVSERLANKNFLLFNDRPLYRVMLETLHEIDLVSEIVINTDSGIIADESRKHYSKVRIIERPEHILGNEVTMNTIIDHDLGVVEGEHFLQTHCTNPLLTGKTIEMAITQYFDHLHTHDSLFSVQVVKKRVYDHNGRPVNHDNHKLEQTQNLPEIFIENSNIFLFSRTSFFANSRSRIGKNPQLFPMDSIEGMDIDYREDFKLAELVSMNRNGIQGLD